MWPVRGCGTGLRVVDESVVLCISIRVEQNPVVRHFCFLLFMSASPGSQPYVRSQKLDLFYWFKNLADRKTFQIRIVDLEDICSLSYSRYCTFE